MNTKLERLGVWPALILGIALAILGGLALNHIVDNWWPIDVARLDLIRQAALGRADAPSLLAAANYEILAAFLTALLVAVTGVFLPLTHFLNKRFGQDTIYPPLLVALRQAMWIGMWGTFCVWLQMNRTFGLGIAGLVAAVFVLAEILLQLRTEVSRVSGQT